MAELTWQHRSYADVTEPTPYGETTTYERGFAWLAEACATVEDWGCGSAWGRRYWTSGGYTGIDGSPETSRFADVLADLRTYFSSRPDGIFMRHVLEHNGEWPLVLTNALASFRRRMVLVLFTPFGLSTARLDNGPGLDLSFRQEDITAFFDAAGLSWRLETLTTDTQYHVEHIFYVTHTPGPVVANRDGAE